MMKFLKIVALCSMLLSTRLAEAVPDTQINQTATVSPVFPESSLPFTLQLDIANFSLPAGIQSFATASWKGKWLFLAGRTNGLHGFSSVGNNFPPSAQNTVVYVIDPSTGESWARDLQDGGLSQEEIDTLSVTNSQFFQDQNTLYVVGGYGINTLTGVMETKDTLTVINVEKMMQWVISGDPSAKSAIQQTSHPQLQVTGGALFQLNAHQPMLLIVGQSFLGLYHVPGAQVQNYTQQIRPFWPIEKGKEVKVLSKPSPVTYPDYRRRDLNVVPILQNNQFAYVVLGGVFTLNTGVWTVPITVFPDGSSFEPDPNDPATFKQAMNHYDCPTFGLYSTKSKEMFVVLPGGMSFGYFSHGVFKTDSEIPFINQMTTIKIDKHNVFTQYLMDSEYPFIASTGTDPGHRLLFGSEAVFFPRDEIPLFRNGVIQLDALPNSPIVIGHIVGGIMSTRHNTETTAETTASPYIFTVTLIPR